MIADMSEFIIQFLLCNIFISIIIVILITIKCLLKNKLTNRAHYNLWFLLLGLLIIPFIPVKHVKFLQVFSWFGDIKNKTLSSATSVMDGNITTNQSNTTNWMNDFSAAVSDKAPSTIGIILYILWSIGILVMIVLILKSILHFNKIKKSALPLQNQAIRILYHDCLREMHITKFIPIYSTAFLKSPIITGLFKPRIYLPIHLISEHNANDIRYMLLHELGHYKSKDSFANYMMNIVGVLYWFNPLVWYSLKEMKNDREVACDTSVLNLLDENIYGDYGNTLINFAEKVSLTSFPFATGISGNMKQMKKRIINISNYHPVSLKKNLHSIIAYIIIAILLLSFVPVLSIRAADNNYYYLDEGRHNIEYIDLSSAFGENKGSFVLYDATKDSWQIYNKDYASMRINPASTFKIYSALLSLEKEIITPDQSQISWNGHKYMYDLWNADQTLESAMQNSVTWYFQTLDQEAGLSSIKNYVQKIGYGNQRVEGDASSYWMNSSLKISPIEQVEMLKKMYDNQFGFSQKNIETVKNSIRLYSTGNTTLYGKTGTEEMNGQNISGWFIGFIEKGNHTYFFATNIQNKKLASGPMATDLTFSILSNLI